MFWEAGRAQPGWQIAGVSIPFLAADFWVFLTWKEQGSSLVSLYKSMKPVHELITP